MNKKQQSNKSGYPDEAIKTLAPVSYTHLDVYKRQPCILSHEIPHLGSISNSLDSHISYIVHLKCRH